LTLLLFAGVIAAPEAMPADIDLPGPLAALAHVLPAAAAPRPSPTPVAVSAGAVVPPKVATAVPAQVPATYAVAGRVTSSTTGSAVARVTVSVRAADTLAVVGSAVTDASGNYSVRVPRGSYKVEFRPGTAFVPEWWNNKTAASRATVLNVENAARTGINASLSSR